MRHRPLGVVADDITGACDLAGTLAELDVHTVVSIGAPDHPAPDAQCLVVALKSRTVEPREAIADSVEAAAWLRDAGAGLLYQKYCSTFDSTDRGNIGPVADALMDVLGADTVSIGTPASPAVGRTQYLGHLFVDGRLLSESSLRHHPLTPMRDPDLVRVLSRQTRRPVSLISHPVVAGGPNAVRAAIEQRAEEGIRHLLVDALTDRDLDAVAEGALAVTDRRPLLICGAAGLAAALARAMRDDEASNDTNLHFRRVPDGRRLIVSGSGSERTREQVRAFRGPRVDLDARALVEHPDKAIDDLLIDTGAALERDPDTAVLVSATAPPDVVRAVQKALGVQHAAETVERALARVATHAVSDHGVTHLIVAGGETSGAVTAALGTTLLEIAEPAAPGVPWTVAEHRGQPIALLLKSGNFGDAALFQTAWECRP